MNALRYWMGILLSVTVFVWGTEAVTIHVPQDYPTIQEAVNGASEGDSIRVAPGTYPESVSVSGKGLEISAEEGPELTVIDAAGRSAPVLKLSGSVSKSFVLDGFSLRNGAGETTAQRTVGGGLFVDGYSAVIRNCLIHDNAATGYDGSEGTPAWGGGMYACGSNLTVENTEIYANEARGGSILYEGAGTGGEAFGGGVACISCNLVLQNVRVETNLCVAGVSGRNDYYQPPVTGVNAFGGGVFMEGGTLEAHGCTWQSNQVIGGNVDDNFGGECPGAIGGDSFGGGAYLEELTALDIREILVAENTSAAGYGISWY